jgi:hypothetical protein
VAAALFSACVFPGSFFEFISARVAFESLHEEAGDILELSDLKA